MADEPSWHAPGSVPDDDRPAPADSRAAHPAPANGWGAPSYGPPPGTWVEPARPGVVPLRPLGLGEILDGAVKTLRHNPRVMFGLSALVMAVVAFVSTLLVFFGLQRALGGVDLNNDQLDTTQIAGVVTSGLVSAVVQFLALSVLNGLLILAVSDAVLGRRPTIGEVWRRAGRRGVGRLLLLTVVTSLIGLALITLVAAPVVALYFVAIPAGVVATLVALPLLVAGGLLLMVRLAFAAPALLLEELGVRAALRRSWRLSLGSSWRVLGILLLSSLIAGAASGLLQLPFSVIAQLLSAAFSAGGSSGSGVSRSALLVTTSVTNLGAVLSTAVTAPFSAGVVSLLYIDLRIRREGLDVALTRAAAERPTPP